MKETCDTRYHTIDDRAAKGFRHEMSQAMIRPFRLMFTQVIIIVMGVYQAYMYGLMYIVLTTFPTL